MKEISEPVEVGGLKLKNRLVRSATWEGIAAADGGIDEDAYAIYDELARAIDSVKEAARTSGAQR